MPRSDRPKMPAIMAISCLILASTPYKSFASTAHAILAGKNIVSASATLSYSDLADHVTAAPIVIRGQVRSVKSIENDRAGVAPQGYKRVLVTTHVTTLIRGESGIPPEISYLTDLPLNTKGKLPRIARQQFLLFARPANRPDFVQLVSRNAQMPWSTGLEQRVRALVAETLAPDSPPAVIAVGDAFHVPGTVEGEGETQIFLKTGTDAPVSLSIIRRPGQPPRWGVSLGEIVDETAAQPTRDTLLWYRLACALPAELPAESIRTLSFLDAQAAQRDYRLVLEGLGTCGRTL